MDRAEARAPALLPLSAAAARAWLQEPWIPASAARALPNVRAAAAARIPVCVSMAPGRARWRMVRALAADAGHTTGIVVCDLDGPLPDSPVILIDPPTWSEARWMALACALDDARAWLLVALAPGETPPAWLASELRLARFEVPALAERPTDVIPLANAILARLAARAGRSMVPLVPAVRSTLEGFSFPGDQDELEAALARAFLASPDCLDPSDLGLTPAPSDAALPPPALRTDRLELLLAEMAHELRNPLVTIKTFADHLPALLEDEALRTRFQGLTADAITRMETVLDNVLEFGRLGIPGHRPVDLPPLLDRVLAELRPELDARGVAAARHGDAQAACAGDAEQLEYAMRNLLSGVVREMPAGQTLDVVATANGVVRIAFTAGGTTAARLRAMAGTTDGDALTDPTLLPLAFTLARGVLERNGGQLEIAGEPSGATTLVVRLPVSTM